MAGNEDDFWCVPCEGGKVSLSPSSDSWQNELWSTGLEIAEQGIQCCWLNDIKVKLALSQIITKGDFWKSSGWDWATWEEHCSPPDERITQAKVIVQRARDIQSTLLREKNLW